MASKRRSQVERIIEVLEKHKECNLNVLRRETGLNYYTLVKLLEELIEKGLVVEKRLGRLRLFRIVENRRRS